MLNITTRPIEPCNELISSIPSIKAIPPFKRCRFTADALHYLELCYTSFVPSLFSHKVSAMYEQFKVLEFWGSRVASVGSRLEHSSIIQAIWAKDGGCIDLSHYGVNRPGIINFFFRQSIPTHEGMVTITMAKVEWFKSHHECAAIGFPFEQWTSDLFEPLGPASFIPVVRLKNLCCSCVLKNSIGESLIAVCPLVQKLLF